MTLKEEIWVAITGIAEHEVILSTSLSDIADQIGASYSTLKFRVKKSPKFRVLVGGPNGQSWFILKAQLTRIKGRGGKRIKGIFTKDFS